MEEPVIINPRGFRPYVRNDSFFQAISLVLAKYPNAKFVCALMAGEKQALQWVEKYGTGQELTHDAKPHKFLRLFEHGTRPSELSVAATAAMKNGETW